MTDWRPEQYLKFKNERTQPSIDLMNRIDVSRPARIIDIGCGPGNSTAVLQGRWPDAELYGLDSSENMIQKARAEHPDIEWLAMGAEEDLSALGQFDIVFSNAALQWMPDHETLIPRLFHLLRDGGALAVQTPNVRQLPIYANIQALIQTQKWAGYFAEPPLYPMHHAYEHYYDILCTLTGRIELWQTDYIHTLPDHDAIVEWYKGSGLRPFLDALPDASLQAAFCDDYRQTIAQAYPIARDGKVPLPFRRVFFVAHKG